MASIIKSQLTSKVPFVNKDKLKKKTNTKAKVPATVKPRVKGDPTNRVMPRR